MLVAGYASTVTRMGDLVLWEVARIVHSELLPYGAAVGGGLVAIVGLAFLGVRRWRRRSRSRPAASMGAIKLGGRKAFLEALSAQLRAHEASGRQLAIHLIDIDRFRTVNEILGEEEGDAFLRLVSERLLVLVDHPERLARIGDDEFAVIQPEAGGARHAEIYCAADRGSR